MLAPAIVSAVEVVWTVVGSEGVCGVVELQLSILDAVADSADCLAKVWAVMCLVLLGCVETLDDVGVFAAD